MTFDGIRVRFRKNDFFHAFFESRGGGKDNVFSRKRAERMDWIESALKDPNSERYEGWISKKKSYSRKRRVCIVNRKYVVVIRVGNNMNASFITAFLADTPSRKGRPSTIDQIRKGPKW